jgi:hypothetical protein
MRPHDIARLQVRRNTRIRGGSRKGKAMYIGIGTVVLIVIIVLIVLLIRR